MIGIVGEGDWWDLNQTFGVCIVISVECLVQYKVSVVFKVNAMVTAG